MGDEVRTGNRTPAGREAALDDHGDRLEALEAWKTLAEYKEGARERRSTAAVRYVITLSITLAGVVAAALLAAGGHI